MLLMLFGVFCICLVIMLLLLMSLFIADGIESKICYYLVPLYCFCDLTTVLCSPEVNQIKSNSKN